MRQNNHFIGRVNLHFGYVLQPQNWPYFPSRRTSSLPQKGHFVFKFSTCCCFSSGFLFVRGYSLLTIACIASCVYLGGVALREARSFFNMFGRRTMTTLHESSGTFLMCTVLKTQHYISANGIWYHCGYKKRKTFINVLLLIILSTCYTFKKSVWLLCANIPCNNATLLGRIAMTLHAVCCRGNQMK